jgi:polyhydroxybutyrate depolymerase
MKRSTALALMLLLHVGAAHAQSATRDEIALEHGGRQRQALVYVPSSYSPSKPAPLVLVFHGGGGNPGSVERMAQMRQAADRHGLIVAYPGGTGRFADRLLTWNAWTCCAHALKNDVDDVGFVRELIAELKRRYSIDPKRIYATGMSNGGMLSYRLACELSDQIAAIAPVAGALNTDSCRPREPVSAVIFHGTDDQHVRFDGGMSRKRFPGSEPRNDRSVEHAFATWSRINACKRQSPVRHAEEVQKTSCVGGTAGAEVVLYAIEGQGHAWPSQKISATDVMIEFFLAHAKR